MPSAEVARILKKKEGILSLEKFLDRKIVVCIGSREIWGTLKGFDNNVNLVLADAKQWDKDCMIRALGACIIRGGDISCVSSGDTASLGRNPFL